MATLKFELISPQQIVFEGEVQSASLSGTEGDLTVYPGHERLFTTLNPGMIEVVDQEGNTFRAFVKGGFAEINETALAVLGESVVLEDELSQIHIDEEIARLQESIENSTDETVKTKCRSVIFRLEQISVSDPR